MEHTTERASEGLAAFRSAPMTRRGLLRGGAIGAAAVALPGLLASCTAGDGSTGKATGGGSGTITHWDWMVSQEPWVKSEIAKFEAKNPGLKIKRTVTQANKYPNVVALAQRSKGLPDVLQIPNTPGFAEEVAKGWYHPLNKLADDAWVKQFPPYSFVEGVNVFDGKLYSAPHSGAAPQLQLYLNNKVFEAAGLADSKGKARLPETWDDVTSFAKTITSKGDGKVFGLGAGNTAGTTLYHWQPVFLFGAGTPGALSQGLDLRTGRYTYGTDRNYGDFLSLLKEWFDKGLFHPGTLSATDEIARAKFANGEIGMIVGGSWNIGGWQSTGFTDYTCTTLISPTKKPKGYFQSTPGGHHIALSSTVSEAETAFEWFSWWNGKDATASWVQKYDLGLSVFPENNDPSKITFAPFAAYAGLADLTKRAPDPAVRNPDAAKVAIKPVTPSIADIITGVMTGQIGDIDSALSDLADRSNKALDASIADAVAAGAKVSHKDFVFKDWDLTKDYAYDIPEYPKL